MSTVKRTLSNFCIFTAGVVIGAVATWKFMEAKYEKIIAEEVDKAYEVYSKMAGRDIREQAEEKKEPVHTPDPEQINLHEYVNTLADAGYIDYASVEPTKVKEVTKVKRPYVISPDDFGDHEEYTIVTLFYCADKVLIHENNTIVDNVDELIGADSLHHFGEYEDDSVFVRNEQLETDFEILLEQRTYEEVIESSPHNAEE
jgi:hypothetical protein